MSLDVSGTRSTSTDLVTLRLLRQRTGDRIGDLKEYCQSSEFSNVCLFTTQIIGWVLC